MSEETSVVMLGATGAVGSRVAHTLEQMAEVSRVTLLGRRSLDGLTSPKVRQSTIDIMSPMSYAASLAGHDVAICTLGVGQPSKVSKEEFVRIDKSAVFDFASSCKDAGVRHFELLGSVGANPESRSFYLRTKGALEEALRRLNFERLSLFRPSMISTPTNRYGFSQAVTLALWPRLKPVLVGGLRKYRGVEVDRLGRAIALNLRGPATGVEVLTWAAIQALAEGAP